MLLQCDTLNQTITSLTPIMVRNDVIDTLSILNYNKHGLLEDSTVLRHCTVISIDRYTCGIMCDGVKYNVNYNDISMIIA